MYEVNMADVKKYLRGKESVSIPELQVAFSLGYGEAKRLLSKLQSEHIVSNGCKKIKYSVNGAATEQRRLTEEECLQIAEIISDDALALLTRVDKTPIAAKEINFSATELLSLDLIYEFDGKYLSCIGWDSLFSLRRARRRLRAMRTAESKKSEDSAQDLLKSLFQSASDDDDDED